MARKVNATFTGTADRQSDPGAWSDENVIENAVGDTALVHDMLTGDNSPGPGTINHTGSGLGVPLGVPLGGSVVITAGRSDGSGYEERVNSAEGSVFYNSAFLFALPIFLPHGQTSIAVSFNTNDAEAIGLEIKDTSWADAGEPTAHSFDGSRWTGRAVSLTGGTLYFVCVTCPIGPTEPIRTWSGLSIYFPGEGTPDQIAAMPELTDPDWPQVPVASQSDSGANIIDQTNWDAAVFANDYAIHAQLTDRLNKNQNALVEFMSGAPAGRNDEYTLTPTSGVDPTSSAFHDHSVSTYENEGEIDFPVLAVPLGAIQNGTTSIDYVTTNFGAPSSTSTGAGVLANDLVFMPDLPDTTSSSRLRFALLLCYPDTAAKGATTCQVQAHWGGGSGTARSSSPATQLGSTDYYYHILGGSGGRIDFGGGTLNQLRLTVTDGKGDISGDEARWVGYTWYFDKDA